MALGATIYNFDVEPSGTDRQVYESLALRVARHPADSEPVRDLAGAITSLIVSVRRTRSGAYPCLRQGHGEATRR